MKPWTAFTFTTVSPLFGGAEAGPDSDDSPIRVPSIRGALRYWFRAVAAAHGVIELNDLWEAEEAIFGSTKKPSSIAIRVRAQPSLAHNREPRWTSEIGIKYLLGQGLWDQSKRQLSRSYVNPGSRFIVEFRFSDDEKINSQLMLAIWAWVIYGGLGARVRRGFGAIECTQVVGALPGNWQSRSEIWRPDWNALQQDPIPPWITELGDPGWGEMNREEFNDDLPLPQFPVLSHQWWGGSLRSESQNNQNSWETVLNAAGISWRNFRLGKAPNDHQNKDSFSPEWITSIRAGAVGRRYDVAGLGLPVNYFEKGSRFKAMVSGVDKNKQSLRRASPVWIKLVQNEKNEFIVFTHVFYSELLPDGAKLVKKVSGVKTYLDQPAKGDFIELLNLWRRKKKRNGHPS
ncbi:MAG: type III-B CRISPR module RAMP protein Cmr1 [Mycobacteriaceae bacterium]